MAIKIDLEKAFDRVEWSCVKHALDFIGFPPCLSNIVMHCITSSSISTLVNGVPGTPFSPFRGLRQWDCLSPYLFILVLELLHLLIENATTNKDWTPLSLGRSGFSLSHCFFADDIILFGRADMNTASTIQNILKLFCGWSGQQISYAKSRMLFSKNTKPCAISSGIAETSNLGHYLGFPLKFGRQLSSDFNFILDKVRSKLQGWKANNLSLAGRMTLITSTSSAIASYYGQHSFLPAQICKNIDSAHKNFLWGSTSHKKKIHLVNWEKGH